MPRVLLDDYQDGSVAAGTTDLTTFPVVPTGKVWVLKRFGGALRDKGVVALQLRTATGPDVWATIRALTGPGSSEFTIDRSYTGDGVTRFRIARIEESGTDQDIVSWIEGYEK